MSKINRLRIINLNYNNNAIKIEDEIYHLYGESTLFSLRNGGGKSVLVQILTSPFVHKRYRDTKDRAFSSYFTTSQPTFILVEWGLDGGVGSVLTGMMVRKRQEVEDEDKDDLEIIQFIHEYKLENTYDIMNFPFFEDIIESGGKTSKKRISFYAAKQLFESLKKDKAYHFDYFDMSVLSQSRQYYEKLNEYRIYYKEWETIIKKVNLKESGLSELFTEAKDEAGLIEKWFLDAVENKLNKEESRIKEFGKILFKYINQYRENQYKILQKQNILDFQKESQIILGLADKFVDVLSEKSGLENKIAGLIKGLEELTTENQKQCGLLEHQQKKLEDEINRILYEEISYNLYQLEDHNASLEVKYHELMEKINNLEKQKEIFIKERYIQECAKLHQEYSENLKEVRIYENDLNIAKSKNEDLTPERDLLGYNLKLHYQREELSKKNYLDEMNIKINANQNRIKVIREGIVRSEKERNEGLNKQGNLKAKIDNFTDSERLFNTRHKENLTRNILGEYEGDSLTSLMQKVKEASVNYVQNLSRYRKEKEENEKNLITYSRNLEDMQKEAGSLEAAKETLAKELAEYEAEINTRKDIMKYIDFIDEKLFHTADILQAFNLKISDREGIVKSFERDINKLREEYKKLETGKVLELPLDLEEALYKEDIHYIFGMDWLKKNTKTVEENLLLVKNNPFIPYSIIMSEGDLKKLKQKKLEIFTSLPIPIVNRSNLETGNDSDSFLVNEGEQVSFLVLFNHALLEEEGLKRLLTEKNRVIDNTLESLERRKAEYQFYIDKRDQIKYQKITEKNYKACLKDLMETKEKLAKTDQGIYELRQNRETLDHRQGQLLEIINKLTLTIKEITTKENELLELSNKYDIYKEQRKEYEVVNKNVIAIDEEIEEKKAENQKLEFQVNYLKEEIFKIENELKIIQSKVVTYQGYKEGEELGKPVFDMELRYEAITKEFTMEQRDIERNLEKARKRLVEKEEERNYKAKHYSLEDSEYTNVNYDRKKDEELEEQIKAEQERVHASTENLAEIKSKIAVCNNKISDQRTGLKVKLNQKEPLPKEEITNIEFQERKRSTEMEQKKVTTQLEKLGSKSFIYEENLSGLVEFHDFVVTSEVDYKKPLRDFEKEELKRLRGNLIREYRMADSDKNEVRQELFQVLLKFMNQKEFSDDFFKKPLETLTALINDPVALREQLSMTLYSYENLLEKLDIDIALIEKEREKVIDILLDYTRDVHQNLGKIDKNSNIRIRERSVKMLRIILPIWEENENIYRTRMQDFVEGVTKRGLDLLDKNLNMEEMIGTQVVTKNLYDTVVGIRNIAIKLYKIEEQREYQISWAEVAKNSGGEGFLSAFVILSSLLSFMRREDTDIFYEYEEGKVLIMDNPFAQTNAAHLLKPLMDIAKKSNTQLICLSGLGGESIYNRFDNIYVLNLITARLRDNLQYLRGEHEKGEEKIQTMVSSLLRTEDMEQMELLF